MDEREAASKKRQREEDGDDFEIDGIELEEPTSKAGGAERKPKKQKIAKSEAATTTETEEERRQRKRDARAAKRERKREQKLKSKEKADRSKARKQAEKAAKNQDKPKKSKNIKQPAEKKQDTGEDGVKADADNDESDESVAEEIDIQQPAHTLTTQLDDESMSDVSEPEGSDVFSPPQESGTSSTSSINPLAEELVQGKPTPPTADPTAPPPKERLANALAAFRSQRNADVDSAPKSRAELLEQRRRQEEKRRAEKKEQKRREKEEAQRQQEAEIAARFSPGGSGSLLNSPRSPISTPDINEPNNFSFGRIAFDDGSAFNPNLQGDTEESSEQRKKKGPSDAATALAAALKKKSRLSGLDDEKKSRIASQDMWMAARKRAAGEKVKDDTSLLKKALKRQEGQKKKSEKEWTDRKEGIDKSIAARQKKRTDNLAKRQEEKGKKGKGKPKRPGFEGSFKGRTGGKKKGKP
jgi:hypothetical protein